MLSILVALTINFYYFREPPWGLRGSYLWTWNVWMYSFLKEESSREQRTLVVSEEGAQEMCKQGFALSNIL